jgi:hypothetical protein
MKKNTKFAGRFDGHANAPVQCNAHCLMEHNQGFMQSHWPLPLGKCTHHIAPAAAMVIDGDDAQNTKKHYF